MAHHRIILNQSDALWEPFVTNHLPDFGTSQTQTTFAKVCVNTPNPDVFIHGINEEIQCKRPCFGFPSEESAPKQQQHSIQKFFLAELFRLPLAGDGPKRLLAK